MPIIKLVDFWVLQIKLRQESLNLSIICEDQQVKEQKKITQNQQSYNQVK